MLRKLICKVFGHSFNSSQWFGGERCCEVCREWIKGTD